MQFIINRMKKTYSRGNDIAETIQTSTRPNFDKQKLQLVASVKPTKAERKAEDRQVKLEFKIQHNQVSKQKNTYLENKCEALAELWGYYSKALQGKIEARTDCALSIHNNPIKLREAIKEHSLSFKETYYEMATIANALYNFILHKQKDREFLLDHTHSSKWPKKFQCHMQEV